jgi:hypothetical protein
VGTIPSDISFKSNGEWSTGRALPEDANSFSGLLDWLRIFSADEVNIEFNLDYFNTSVSKQILDMFKIIEGNPANKVINMKWMYEDGDDEMLESGEIYSEMLKRFQFTYHKYAEIVD